MFNDRLLYRFFSTVSIFLFVLAMARLFYLQVVQYDFYNQIVTTQSNARVVFTKDRGKIFDLKGMPLAYNIKSASLYAFGKNIKDAEQTLRELEANGLKLSNNIKKAIRNKDSFIWISRQMNIQKAEQIKLAVKGVGYYLEDARFYPEGGMLAGVIGHTGVDNQGLSGIEYYADRVLAGNVMPVNTIRDSRGELILFDDGAINTAPDSAIYLTIDAQLQAIAEQIMKEDVNEYKAKSGIALAIDIKSGAVLMSAAVVRKNGKAEIIESKNAATTFLFEPGSIFKAVSFAFLMEKGMFNAKAIVDTSKAVELYGHSIRDVHPTKSLSQAEVFTKSSNIGTVKLTSSAKKVDFYNFLTTCGFGKETNIEWAAEESGILRDVPKWSGLSLASLSIGQEILVTPMQVARFYAAVANGGIAYKPSIISKYILDDKPYYPKVEPERIFSENTATMMMGLMESHRFERHR